MLDRIYKTVKEKKLTGVVFLDLKKAFDTINHQILLNILLGVNVSNPSEN